MFAAENWCIKVHDKVYGPYTTQQMRKYAHEGRLAAWSLISPAGGRAWLEAREEGAFANFFGHEKTSSGQAANTTFGRREETLLEAEVSQIPDYKPPQREPAANLNVANFIVVFDVVSAAASRVEAAIHSLGNSFRIADNAWSVTCELTAIGVRNSIAPYLLGNESIFVIDASRGRTSWQNYSPEAHSKITAAYNRAKYQ